MKKEALQKEAQEQDYRRRKTVEVLTGIAEKVGARIDDEPTVQALEQATQRED